MIICNRTADRRNEFRGRCCLALASLDLLHDDPLPIAMTVRGLNAAMQFVWSAR